MREGAEYFTDPASAAQRRYEALRAYFLDDMPAAEVADRFGTPPLASTRWPRCCAGRLTCSPWPGPARGTAQGHRGAARPGAGAAGGRAQRHRDRRRAHRRDARIGVTCWQILDAEGCRGCPAAMRGAADRRPGWTRSRLARCPAGRPRFPAVRSCRLLLLLPGICEVGLPDLIAQASYPSTRELSAWQSTETLLLAKCARTPRVSHAATLTDDQVWRSPSTSTLPKSTTSAPTPAGQPRRRPELLSGLVQALRPLGLAAEEDSFKCDFLVSRHHGARPSWKHYVLRRSQRTRAVLTFFAQDHATSDMVYSNADITKPSRPGRSSRSRTTGSRPPDQTPGCWSSTPS